MRILGWTRLIQGEDWSHSLFCLTFLLWTSMSGLADFSSKMHRIYKKQDIYIYNKQCCSMHNGWEVTFIPSLFQRLED